MRLTTRQRQTPRSSRKLPGILIAAILLVAALGFASEPSPVEARSITCQISVTSRLPTKAQYHDLVAAEVAAQNEDGEPFFVRGGQWHIFAPVPSRCQALLGKGQYMYRAQWSVSMRLASGWPIGIEYVNSRDAAFTSHLGSYEPLPANGFYTPWAPPEYYPLVESGKLGRMRAPLTDLCFGERCVFTIEETGTHGRISGNSIPAIHTLIEMCFRYRPQGAAGLAETEPCNEPGNYHAHPGTFGMQVTVSGTMTFEPLWTWRR